MREASFRLVWRQCCLVADHDFGVQRPFSHEAPGAGGEPGESPSQSDTLVADRPYLAACLRAAGSFLLDSLGGGIRRTLYTLKHEGGCFAYTIRADGQDCGARVVLDRG